MRRILSQVHLGRPGGCAASFRELKDAHSRLLRAVRRRTAAAQPEPSGPQLEEDCADSCADDAKAETPTGHQAPNAPASCKTAAHCDDCDDVYTARCDEDCALGPCDLDELPFETAAAARRVAEIDALLAETTAALAECAADCGDHVHTDAERETACAAAAAARGRDEAQTDAARDASRDDGATRPGLASGAVDDVGCADSRAGVESGLDRTEVVESAARSASDAAAVVNRLAQLSMLWTRALEKTAREARALIS